MVISGIYFNIRIVLDGNIVFLDNKYLALETVKLKTKNNNYELKNYTAHHNIKEKLMLKEKNKFINILREDDIGVKLIEEHPDKEIDILIEKFSLKDIDLKLNIEDFFSIETVDLNFLTSEIMDDVLISKLRSGEIDLSEIEKIQGECLSSVALKVKYDRYKDIYELLQF